jgi:hypothetical protein
VVIICTTYCDIKKSRILTHIVIFLFYNKIKFLSFGLYNENYYVLCEVGSQYLGAYARNYEKATIRSYKSVCPSFRLSVRKARLPLDGFSLNFILEEFSKISVLSIKATGHHF